jgi:hypothetical protein
MDLNFDAFVEVRIAIVLQLKRLLVILNKLERRHKRHPTSKTQAEFEAGKVRVEILSEVLARIEIVRSRASSFKTRELSCHEPIAPPLVTNGSIEQFPGPYARAIARERMDLPG